MSEETETDLKMLALKMGKLWPQVFLTNDIFDECQQPPEAGRGEK